MNYSKRWLRNASDEELETEREKVRTSPEPDLASGTRKYNTLRAFDDEMIERANKKYREEHPDAKPRPPREHGWYLPNDD